MFRFKWLKKLDFNKSKVIKKYQIMRLVGCHNTFDRIIKILCTKRWRTDHWRPVEWMKDGCAVEYYDYIFKSCCKRIQTGHVLLPLWDNTYYKCVIMCWTVNL